MARKRRQRTERQKHNDRTRTRAHGVPARQAASIVDTTGEPLDAPPTTEFYPAAAPPPADVDFDGDGDPAIAARAAAEAGAPDGASGDVSTEASESSGSSTAALAKHGAERSAPVPGAGVGIRLPTPRGRPAARVAIVARPVGVGRGRKQGRANGRALDRVSRGAHATLWQEVSGRVQAEMIVPRQVTPIGATEARDALIEAWPTIDRNSASLLLSLIWIETGRGRLIQHNPGMVSAGRSWTGNAWRPPWFEPEQTDPALQALHARMLRGEAPSAFRAYDTLPEGMADFVAVINRMPGLVEAARSGDTSRFITALRQRYSSDYRDAHAVTFNALRREFDALLSDLPAPPPAATFGAMGTGALLLGAALLLGKKGFRLG